MAKNGIPSYYIEILKIFHSYPKTHRMLTVILIDFCEKTDQAIGRL